MARYLAKNIVASGMCNNYKVELSYIIGIPQPCGVNIEMDINCDKVETNKQWINENVDLTQYGFFQRFKDSDPRYYIIAKNGHYGFDDKNYYVWNWEKLDLVDELKKLH